MFLACKFCSYLYMKMLNAFILVLHKLLSKYLCKKFGNMTAIMWGFPKIVTTTKLANQQRKQSLSHIISLNHKDSKEQQYHGIYLNSSIFQLVLVPYSLGATKLSYMHSNYKLDLNSPNSTQNFILCQDFNLHSFVLKFYKNIALLVYFQISLVLLNFDKYNLSYLHLIHCCPILKQTKTPISEKSPKKSSFIILPWNFTCLYSFDPFSNKQSLMQFGLGELELKALP